MSEIPFPLDAYLERIDYRGPVVATVDVLDAIQRAQLAAIPFENFDILVGRGISLAPEALFDKLIRSPRGGYCFELNGLLLMALQAIGFEARGLLARVHLRGKPTVRSHELILVEIDGQCWLADAGFGGPSMRAPIPFEREVSCVQDGERLRLVDAGDFGTMLQKELGGEWRDLYSFDLGRIRSSDIEASNLYASTHPDSRFTHTRVAALQTETGKVTLRDLTLRHVENGIETIRELPEGSQYLEALTAHFGIELGVPYEALRPLGAESRRALQ